MSDPKLRPPLGEGFREYAIWLIDNDPEHRHHSIDDLEAELRFQAAFAGPHSHLYTIRTLEEIDRLLGNPEVIASLVSMMNEPDCG